MLHLRIAFFCIVFCFFYNNGASQVTYSKDYFGNTVAKDKFGNTIGAGSKD